MSPPNHTACLTHWEILARLLSSLPKSKQFEALSLDVWADKHGRQMLKGLAGAARKKKQKVKPKPEVNKEVKDDLKNNEQKEQKVQVNNNVISANERVAPPSVPVQSGAGHLTNSSAPGKVQLTDKSVGLKQENVAKSDEGTNLGTDVKMEPQASVSEGNKKTIKMEPDGKAASIVKSNTTTPTAKKPGKVRREIGFQIKNLTRCRAESPRKAFLAMPARSVVACMKQI